MTMRLPWRKRKPKQSDVTLTLSTHNFADTYMHRPPLKGTKSVIVEKAYAIYPRRPNYWNLRPDTDAKKEKTSRYHRTQADYLDAAHQRGMNIFAGESLPLPPTDRGYRAPELDLHPETDRLHQMYTRSKQRREKALIQPTLTHIRDYFSAYNDIVYFRERLIRDTIREVPKPVEARYGTSHSILSRDLQKDRFTITREIEPQVFTHDAIVLRKMRLRKEPTDRELSLAWITYCSETPFIERLTGKPIDECKDAELQFTCLARKVLLDQLEKKNPGAVDYIREHIAQNPGLFERVLMENGLPAHPKRGQLEEFLEKHSIFYRRQLANKKNRKATRPRWKKWAQRIGWLFTKE